MDEFEINRREMFALIGATASLTVLPLGASVATVNEQQLQVLRDISAKLSTIIGHLATLASTVKPDETPPAVTVTDVTEAA